MTTLAIAAAQYPISPLADWAAYEAKLTRWCHDAATDGAQLAVFPEYAGMELAHLDPASAGDLAASLAFVAGLAEPVAALHQRLAAETGLHILAGSLPVGEGGVHVNRARLHAPNGKSGYQDKLVMTRFEAEQWGVSPGAPVRLFETTLGRIAVAICYDSEFPLIARAQADAGADLILVPSCTDTPHGYHRVRIACQARALENQLPVIQSPTVGLAPWSPAVDENHGMAAVYLPPDGDLPADGVLVQGAWNAPQWLHATLDLARIRRVRESGQVLNHRDWAHQPGASVLPPVEVVDLR